MEANLPDGRKIEFPDGTPQSVIDKYISKYHPPEPDIVDRTIGHLSRGVGRALEMVDNFNQYSGMGVKEYPYQSSKVNVGEFFGENKYANQVNAYPEQTWYGQLLGGAVEFLPQVPVYSTAGGATIRGATLLPKVGKYAEALLTKGSTPVREWGKAVARGTVEGGVVGSTIGVKPGTDMSERLTKGAEESLGFGAAVGVLHPVLKGTGYIAKGIWRRLGKKATPESVEAELAKQAERNPEAAKDLEAIRQNRAQEVSEVDNDLLVIKGQGELELEPLPKETLDKFEQLGYKEADLAGKTDEELIDILDKGIVNDKTNEAGISGSERRGEAVKQGELEQVAGETKVEAGGDVQALEGKTAPQEISDFLAGRERRRLGDLLATENEVANQGIADSLGIRYDGKTKMFGKDIYNFTFTTPSGREASFSVKPGKDIKEVYEKKVKEFGSDTVPVVAEKPTSEHNMIIADKRTKESTQRLMRMGYRPDEIKKMKESDAQKIFEDYARNEAEAERIVAEKKAKGRELIAKVEEKQAEKVDAPPVEKEVLVEDLQKKLDEVDPEDFESAADIIDNLRRLDDPVLNKIIDDMPKTEEDIELAARRELIEKRAAKIAEEKASAERAAKAEAAPKTRAELEAFLAEKRAARGSNSKGKERRQRQKIEADKWEKKLQEEGMGEGDVVEVVFTDKNDAEMIHELDFERGSRTYDEIEDGVYLDSFGASRFQRIYEQASKYVKDKGGLVQLGKSVYLNGYHSFEGFVSKCKEVLGDAWNSVRRYAREAYQAARDWNEKLGERGSIRVGHGTGVYFDTVKNAFIGSGEGAQIRGWGHYFSSGKGVYEWYARMIGGRNRTESYQQLSRRFEALDNSGLHVKSDEGRSILSVYIDDLVHGRNNRHKFFKDSIDANRGRGINDEEYFNLVTIVSELEKVSIPSTKYVHEFELPIKGEKELYVNGKPTTKEESGLSKKAYERLLAGDSVDSVVLHLNVILNNRNKKTPYERAELKSRDQEAFEDVNDRILRDIEYLKSHDIKVETVEEGLNLLDLDAPVKPEQRIAIIEAIDRKISQLGENPSRKEVDAVIGGRDAYIDLQRLLNTRTMLTETQPASGQVIGELKGIPENEISSWWRNLTQEERDSLVDAYYKEGGEYYAMTGDDVQEALREVFGPRKASKFLWEEAGIHGNTYIGDSSGVRNYVIFDEQFVPPKIGTYTLDFMGLQQLFEIGKKIVNSFRTQQNVASNKVLSEINGKQLTRKDDADFVEGSVGQILKNAKEFIRYRGMSPDFAIRNNPKVEPLVTNLHLGSFDANFAASKRNEIVKIAHTMVPDKNEQLLIKPYLERDKWGKELDELNKDIADITKKPTLTDAEARWLAKAPEHVKRLEKKIAEEAQRSYPPHVVKAAEMIKSELAAVREKYKDFLRDQMKKNLNEDENAALAEILGGKSIDDVIAKYKEHIVKDKLGRRRLRAWLDEAVIRDIAKDYEKIDRWGLDDYITHYERGTFRIVSGNKLYAKAMSVEDAARKFEKLAELYPDKEFELDTKHDMEALAAGVSRKQYGQIVNNLQKGIKEAVDGINSSLARRAAEKGLENRFFVKPSKQFSPFTFDRHDFLEGEANVFDILYTYFYSMEKKMALDPAIDDIRRAISRMDVVGREQYKARDGSIKEREIKRAYLKDDEIRFLERYVEDVKGRLYKGDEYVDALFKNSANQRLYSRAVQTTRELQANLKLGYAPVKGFINGASALGHVWTKVGTKFTKDGATFLRTPEGKAFIRDMEPYLGINIVESATGELTTRGFFEKYGFLKPPKTKAGKMAHAAIEPLGAFQYPELPVRKLTLAANYLMAKSEGMTEEAARLTAIKANWFQQFTYDMASLPELMRSPTGRLVTQFKPYLLKELEFISTLRGGELGRYIAMQVALGGPRGLVMVAKSLPILGAWYGWNELEDWANKNYPVASRGIGGVMGVDITAAATFQLPTKWQDWAGPTISDLVSLYTNVFQPSVANTINYMTGGGVENQVDVEGMKALTSTIPIMRHWANVMEQVVDKDGWVKDERNRRLWHIDNMASFVTKSMSGAEPIELNRLRVAEYNLTQKDMKITEQKTLLIDDILDAIAKGAPIDDDMLDRMVKLGVKPSTLRRAARFRVLDPKMRRVLMTDIIRRPEILEMYPDAEDLE